MDGIKNYLTDMDGVILQGSTLLPGAAEFVQRLRAREIPFLILTNNSRFTQRDLQMRLSYMGLEVPPEAIFTSALATAQFLHDQQPEGRAFVIGESGPTTGPHDMRTALRTLDAHSEDSVMIGDRMDTDIVAGIESGLRTILVLTGVTRREQVERFPYRPSWILESIADVEL